MNNKGMEENNRREKTRDHFKKFGDYQGNISCTMGTVKDRDGMDLTSRRC